MTQKFHHGDLVHVAKDLGEWMAHFDNDIDAIVLYTYKEQCGGSDEKSYGLYLKGRGECSWYYEWQLELVEKNRQDLLAQWRAERDAENRQKSDLDWIFEHGPEVLERPHGASVQALANGVGVTNLWGSHGEGLAYYENSARVLTLAQPFLKAKDKHGWLLFCADVTIPTITYDFHKDQQ